LHALPETLVALESRTTATTLRFGPAPVPAALRALAAEGIGATGYMLERLRCSQGEPVSLTVAYLPEIVGRRLRRWIPGRASIMTIVDRLGPPTAVVNWAVAAVAADIDAARALAVPLGAPLLTYFPHIADVISANFRRPSRASVPRYHHGSPNRPTNFQKASPNLTAA
jgi:DNA-binding GntR family transcriptional regulator